ncbi:hypothetical protein TARUN_3222 [Trichoderma arundinaceum]|uniref:Myb transcription factor n=1 Tax=Trichoderma arundinaceum TaxID=490622 RepID=A0A395NSS7_TRIAR|nr:hypothetical protein TARUN_3222 [Trichoderma arundinaceum]
MPANAKWPDFQLASKLRYFMGSSAPESTLSETTSSPQLDQAKREEPQAAQDSDQELGSQARTASMAEIDKDPVEEMEDVEDYEHEGDDAGVDVDFGDLEMFDSNASQLPFSSQAPQSLKAEEPAFPTPSGSAKRDKSKKKKSKDTVQASDFVVDDEPPSSASSKRKKSKKKSLHDSEFPGDEQHDADPDATSATPASKDHRRGSDAVDDAATGLNALDLAPIPSTQKKKKRKPSDSVDGKRHKKRKGSDDGNATIIQQTQDEVENIDTRDSATSFLHLDKNTANQHLGVVGGGDVSNADDQLSPSIAQARRRSQSGEGTRSRENSVPLRAQVAPMAPMAIDTLPQGSPHEEVSNSQRAASGDLDDERDVEDLAREAWREHINSQNGNGNGPNEIDSHQDTSNVNASGDLAEAEEQSILSPSRRRSTRTKKTRPTLLLQAMEATETPARKNRRILEELPSPSANTPKPRSRAKRATKKQSQPTLQSLEDNSENAEDEEMPERPSNTESYTQGRFTDAEFDGISRAVEAFRSEYGLTQVEVNEMIQAPGGTTAGDAHARLWYRLFEVCPDRKRQKVINVARKKFHNFVARGTWTPEQDAELSALIGVHGTAWSKIAAIINRHPEDVRDRYRNYIVCGPNQRKDVWSEEEEARLTEHVKEAMEAIDELRNAQPKRSLLLKAYEELIDWQNISEKMERTRSRLQCITKWKAMQNRISGKKKDKRPPPPQSVERKRQPDRVQAEVFVSDEDISSQLDLARQQMVSMREEEQYRLVLAIQGASVLSDAQIPWAKLLDKKFRSQWSRGAQVLLWDRLKQTVPDWEAMTVLDVAQHIINEYNRTGGLPEVTGSGYDDDDREKELLQHLRSRNRPTAAPKSAEFIEDSGAEESKEDEQQSQEDKIEMTIDPALMGEPQPSPQKATAKQKKATPKKTPAKKKSKRTSLGSQDPIEDGDPILPLTTVDEGEESNLDEAQIRKTKTPSKFRSVNNKTEENGNAALQTEPYSDSVMDDMEDLPARIPA